MKGLKAEWANLPKRKCDNCGTPYKPMRPLRANERGFCQDNCRKEYHKHGGTYGKLKPVIIAEVRKRIKELSPADATRMEAIEKQLAEMQAVIERVREAVNGSAVQ